MLILDPGSKTLCARSSQSAPAHACCVSIWFMQRVLRVRSAKCQVCLCKFLGPRGHASNGHDSVAPKCTTRSCQQQHICMTLSCVNSMLHSGVMSKLDYVQQCRVQKSTKPREITFFKSLSATVSCSTNMLHNTVVPCANIHSI